MVEKNKIEGQKNMKDYFQTIGKKIISISLVLSLLFVLTPITANAETNEKRALDEYLSEGMKEDLAMLKARGTLRVGILTEGVVGFIFEDENGELAGVDIDLAKNIANALEVEAEFVKIDGSYDDLTEALKNGDVDIVVSTYSHSLSRIQYVNFSEPYLTSNVGIMVGKSAMVKAGINNNPIPYMKENSVNIAVLGGTSHVDIAKMLFPYANIIEAGSYDETTELVVDGEAFAALSIDMELYTRYLARPELSLFVTTYVLSDINDQYCVGINTELPSLVDFIDLYLETSSKLSVKDVEKIFDAMY